MVTHNRVRTNSININPNPVRKGARSETMPVSSSSFTIFGATSHERERAEFKRRLPGYRDRTRAVSPFSREAHRADFRRGGGAVQHDWLYWVPYKLPQIYTSNPATFPIQIHKIIVQICGNFLGTQ